MQSIEINFEKSKKITVRETEDEFVFNENFFIQKARKEAEHATKKSEIEEEYKTRFARFEANAKDESAKLTLKTKEFQSKLRIASEEYVVSEKQKTMGAEHFRNILGEINSYCQKLFTQLMNK